jgi:hypothetical protein
LKNRTIISAFVVALACSVLAVAAAATAGGEQQPLTVKSSLLPARLPHRIQWLARPSLPPAQMNEVLFMIDGKVAWVEHHAPYSYGFDGNYLVTSWLKPGPHHFSLRAVANDSRVATTTMTATVAAATPPPSSLNGMWKRTLTAAEAGKEPAGTWKLTVTKVGWHIAVPPGGANLIDVAYLTSSLLELRGGIWTKPAPNDNPQQGNGWCDEPFQPVRYHWRASATTLTFTLAGPKRCGGESTIVAGTWTR